MSRSSPIRPALLLGTAVLVISPWCPRHPRNSTRRSHSPRRPRSSASPRSSRTSACSTRPTPRTSSSPPATAVSWAPAGAGRRCCTSCSTPREALSFSTTWSPPRSGLPTARAASSSTSTGDAEQLVVTSRLYSTAPEPTVGMFIPGLTGSLAHLRSVLTSIQNGGSPPGFRTNAGVFNPGDSPVRRDLPDLRPTWVSSVDRMFPGRWARSFSTPGQRDLRGGRGPGLRIQQRRDHRRGDGRRYFSYAAVIDNATSDPIFVVRASDGPSSPTTPSRTQNFWTRTVTRTMTSTPTASTCPTVSTPRRRSP